jgi:sulfate transport system permease protein
MPSRVIAASYDVSNTHSRRAHRPRRRPRLGRLLLIALALVFLGVFLVLPLLAVFVQAFAKGVGAYLSAISDPMAWAAVKLTLWVAVMAVPLNLVFGVAAAWAIAKFEFRGKNTLITLIDLPFAVSPVIAGLVFILIFGTHGWFGAYVRAHHIRVVFALPGIVLATIFVTFPFIARELIPVMQAQGKDDEETAVSLGASGWQTFWRVTLPNIRWALLYGVLLCNARAMGEFSAVSLAGKSFLEWRQPELRRAAQQPRDRTRREHT